MCRLVLVCPVGSVGSGGEPGEGLVWSAGVVFGTPVLEHDSGFEEVGEVLGVEAFVSQASVEGLDVGVLPGGSGLDVGGVGAPDAAPVVLRRVLRRRAMPVDEPLDGSLIIYEEGSTSLPEPGMRVRGTTALRPDRGGDVMAVVLSHRPRPGPRLPSNDRHVSGVWTC